MDLQKVIVWDTKKDNNNTDNDNNNNKYFAIFTNREESVFTYVSSFEKIWLLEKVIKCNLDWYYFIIKNDTFDSCVRLRK